VPGGVEPTDPARGLGPAGAREPAVTAVDYGTPIDAGRAAAIAAGTAERVALAARAATATATRADQDTV
jgi:hypothetical protein